MMTTKISSRHWLNSTQISGVGFLVRDFDHLENWGPAVAVSEHSAEVELED